MNTVLEGRPLPPGSAHRSPSRVDGRLPDRRRGRARHCHGDRARPPRRVVAGGGRLALLGLECVRRSPVLKRAWRPRCSTSSPPRLGAARRGSPPRSPLPSRRGAIDRRSSSGRATTAGSERGTAADPRAVVRSTTRVRSATVWRWRAPDGWGSCTGSPARGPMRVDIATAKSDAGHGSSTPSTSPRSTARSDEPRAPRRDRGAISPPGPDLGSFRMDESVSAHACCGGARRSRHRRTAGLHRSCTSASGSRRC